MSINEVTAGNHIPHEFNVIVEIPMNGEPIKYEVDKQSGALFVDRFMKTAMHYPANYGYVPHTVGDAKLLAVPVDEICPLFEHWKSIADVPEIRLRQIQHFFEHYKDLEAGKWVKIIGWAGVDVAHAEILNGIKRYEAERSSSAAR